MASRTTPAKSAVDSAIAEKKDKGFGSVAFDGVEYSIERKPSTLLVSELARTGSGDPEAMGVFADFFECTLGSNYPAFKKAVYRSDSDDVEADLQKALQDVLEKTLGRPTK
ncbi:hypothetical protein JNUCC0626_18210 [Lentzea sp. JNUCC 0626]|uniref:hypothetical protein n=1 Tax=Lentzea sp. JNUCC 0626 TaxID=3367513 RepID=UPI00374A567E